MTPFKLKYTEDLEAFLTAASIPQEAGFVQGDPLPPTREKLLTGLGTVKDSFDLRLVSLYLGQRPTIRPSARRRLANGRGLPTREYGPAKI